MFGDDRHGHNHGENQTDEAIEMIQAAAIEELVNELPEELAKVAVWLDARNEVRFHRLEAMMTQLSDAVTTLTDAVKSAGDRVSAEIADLETKIADPNTTVTAADLDGLKAATDAINQIAVNPPVDTTGDGTEAPTDGGTGGDTTPPTDTTPVDGTGVDTTGGTGVSDTPNAPVDGDVTPPAEGGDAGETPAQ